MMYYTRSLLGVSSIDQQAQEALRSVLMAYNQILNGAKAVFLEWNCGAGVLTSWCPHEPTSNGYV